MLPNNEIKRNSREAAEIRNGKTRFFGALRSKFSINHERLLKPLWEIVSRHALVNLTDMDLKIKGIFVVEM